MLLRFLLFSGPGFRGLGGSREVLWLVHFQYDNLTVCLLHVFLEKLNPLLLLGIAREQEIYYLAVHFHLGQLTFESLELLFLRAHRLFLFLQRSELQFQFPNLLVSEVVGDSNYEHQRYDDDDRVHQNEAHHPSSLCHLESPPCAAAGFAALSEEASLSPVSLDGWYFLTLTTSLNVRTTPSSCSSIIISPVWRGTPSAVVPAFFAAAAVAFALLLSSCLAFSAASSGDSPA